MLWEPGATQGFPVLAVAWLEGGKTVSGNCKRPGEQFAIRAIPGNDSAAQEIQFSEHLCIAALPQ